MKTSKSKHKEKVVWKVGDGMTVDFKDSKDSQDVYPKKFGLIKRLHKEVRFKTSNAKRCPEKRGHCASGCTSDQNLDTKH